MEVTKTVKTGTMGRWKPLIEVPEVVPSLSFLEGDGADEFLTHYNKGADTQYGDAARNVKVLQNENGMIVGSNPLAAIYARNTARIFGWSPDIRLATQADLERALKAGVSLNGTYEDTGLVLRTAGDTHEPNDYVAKNLAEQVRARDPKLGKLKVPVVISLNGLDLKRDSNSHYGLAFVLHDDAQLIDGEILRKGGQFKSQDIDAQTGLPTKLDAKGNRASYVTEQGLSWLCLGRVLDLYSGNWYLANSSSYGRVALVRGEAARTEF